ncbi:phosphatase PAP2 family protein [Dyella silvatica]|uniref:phosphatase PAP2 family protein n=1 Tax=Dyella silvatica TaxID=2992128 RepID=UPI00225B822C|nr:phosphatase PAP2 family protein [Dyella silvatica]
MKTYLQRMRAIALGWGAVGLVYGSSSILQRQGVVLQESALDRMMPYNPHGVWLYLSFFVLIPLTYASIELRQLPWLTRAMQLCAAICMVVFMLWPTTLMFPPIVGHSASDMAMRLLAAGDTTQNCLPSLHGALTLLCAWALLDRKRPWRSLLALLWGLGIAYATVQTRRHLSADLSAGMLLGLICGYLSYRLCSRPTTSASTAASCNAVTAHTISTQSPPP